MPLVIMERVMIADHHIEIDEAAQLTVIWWEDRGAKAGHHGEEEEETSQV